MNCETCKDKHAKADPVPFAAYETAVDSMRYTIKRLWVLAILLALMLFGSNAAWIYYESQWEVVETTETYEATTDGGGTAIANGSGIVTAHGEG